MNTCLFPTQSTNKTSSNDLHESTSEDGQSSDYPGSSKCVEIQYDEPSSSENLKNSVNLQFSEL